MKRFMVLLSQFVVTISISSCGSQVVDYASLSYDETLQIACDAAEMAYSESSNETSLLLEAEKAFRALSTKDAKFTNLADELQDAIDGRSDWGASLEFCGTWSYEQLQSQPSDLESPEAKSQIDTAVNSYFKQNCTPKYWTQNLSGFKYKTMTPYFSEYFTPGSFDPQISTQEWMYLDTTKESSYYGNFAIRTIFLASVYEYQLSGVYSDIFQNYQSDLKSYVDTFYSFAKLAHTSSQSVCQIAKKSVGESRLATGDLDKVQEASKALIANWEVFKTWIKSAEGKTSEIEGQIDADYKDATTPKCSEYPTEDGQYVLVKCSMPN